MVPRVLASIGGGEGLVARGFEDYGEEADAAVSVVWAGSAAWGSELVKWTVPL